MADLMAQQDLLETIARLLVESAPTNWQDLSAHYLANAAYGELLANFVDSRGEHRLDPPPDGLVEPFEKLRDAMYADGGGAWFAAHVAVGPDGRFRTSFDYDAEPAFSMPPDDTSWADELDSYPRRPEAVPAWLRDRAERGGWEPGSG